MSTRIWSMSLWTSRACDIGFMEDMKELSAQAPANACFQRALAIVFVSNSTD
jgi:hypothetical protein